MGGGIRTAVNRRLHQDNKFVWLGLRRHYHPLRVLEGMGKPTIVVEESAIRGTALSWFRVDGRYAHLTRIAIWTRAWICQLQRSYDAPAEPRDGYFSIVAIAKASRESSVSAQ